MFKEMKKRVKNEKGLTLIELLAVIVILAIIAAIAIPAIGNIINNSRDKAILSEALNIMSGAKIAHMDGQCTEASGVSTCNATVLNKYVDGVTLTEGTDVVTFTAGATGGWSIKYSGFSEIVNTSDYTITGGTATEEQIKTMLD